MASRPEGLSPPHAGLAGLPWRRPSPCGPSARRTRGQRLCGIAPGARRSGAGDLNVVSHNVHGMGVGAIFRPGVTASGPYPHSKGERLLRLWKNLRAQIVLLQETHADQLSIAILEGLLHEWTCFWAPAKVTRSDAHGDGASRPSAGVAILIRKSALIQHGGHLRVVDGSLVTQRDGRAVSLKVDWMGHSLHLASIYQPNAPAAQREFITQRLAALAQAPGVGARTCVWGGDFNFTPNPGLDRVTGDLPSPPSHPDSATAAVWAHALPDLVDTFRALHPRRREYTYFHRHGASRLDRVYISSKGFPYVTTARVAGSEAPGACSISDHRPVTASLLGRCALAAPRRRTGARRTLAPRVRTEFLQDAALAEQYRLQTAQLASVAPAAPRDLLAWWPSFKDGVARVARTLYAQHRLNTAAFVKTADGAVEAAQRGAAAGDAAAVAGLPAARHAARRAGVAAQQALTERCSWLHPRELPSPGLTARLRPPQDVGCGPALRAAGGVRHTSPGACAEIMVDHCAAISAQPSTDGAARGEVLAALEGHPQMAPEAGGGEHVNLAEVRAVLRKARSTQPGLDGLKVALYRAAKDTFVPLLARVFSAIGVEDEMPSGFHTGVIVPLHKAGDRTLPANYRPITLLNTDYRLLAAVLGTRLAPNLLEVIDPVQTAFLQGRSIGENIMCLQILPHALAAAGRSGVLAVCDFQKAYDTVDRGFLLEVMRRLGAGPVLLKWVRLLLSGTTARALVMGQLSRLTTFHAGVRQGCPLAPLLYLFVAQSLLAFLKARGVGMDLPAGPVLAALSTESIVGSPTPSSMFPPFLPAPASGLQLAPQLLTALQYADDCKALLPSFADVPLFLAAMHTFGEASGQRLSQRKSQLLEIGAVGPLEAAPLEVHGLKVVDRVKALGVVFHRGVTPASAQWDDLLDKVEVCYRRATRVNLSAFGRGFASAAYGVSRLLHAAEFTGLPAAAVKRLQQATSALVDRDEPPGLPLSGGEAADEPGRSFAGVRWDLLCGRPETGGLGALNFQHHLSARAAKWGLRLLLDGTTRPWTTVAWSALAAHLPCPPLAVLGARHVFRQFNTLPAIPAPAVPLPPSLPPPLRRILDSLRALPALGRRTRSEQGVAALQPEWLHVLELVSWRLHHQDGYAANMLRLGTPAWVHPPPWAGDGMGTALWDYSVRRGARLLTAPAELERGERFRLFVEEGGGALPAALVPPAAMGSALRRLWRLPFSNHLKQTFWYCFLNGLPVAARMPAAHPRPCGCGTSGARPDRRHHFAECPAAQAVVQAIQAALPAPAPPNLLADLRAVSPPAGIHVGVWSVVALAAVNAMEAARRRQAHLQQQRLRRRGADLAAELATFSLESFWTTLSIAAAAPLPTSWREKVPADHPFLGWDAPTARWLVRRPAP